MKNLLRTLLAVSVFLLYSQTVFCAEGDLNTTEPTDETPVTDATETQDGSKFNDREQLIQTILGDLDGEDGEPTDDVDTDIPSPDEPEVPEIPGEDNGEPTQERVTAFVEKLTDEQAFALNRSLNNAVNNGLPVEYDMVLLEKVVEENYNSKQINALTKALEEDAKFQALYEKTGNEKFLEKAEKQKDKFLSKIDRFQDDDGMDDLLSEELQDLAKDSAKDSAKLAAKDAAKDAVKESVKEVAKTTKKEAVKTRQAEKKAAKDAAKVKKEKSAKPEKTKKEKPTKPEKPAKTEKPEKEKPEQAGKK
ncbi:MAG: hypothetical protein QTN59_03550 [Candidatus Electrothrix communis]|nr:MAG: hypothetical protein QTN59_03550 [Candidatus Electrothrix communis]